MAIRRYYRQVIESSNMQGRLFVCCDDCYKELNPNEGIKLRGVDGEVPPVLPCEICSPDGELSKEDKDLAAKRKRLKSFYYNTTRLQAGDLHLAMSGAKNQDEKILVWLMMQPGERRGYIRDEVHNLCLPRAQNTSIGRALNTLMKCNYVTKGPKQRKGKYKSVQYEWTLIR